MDAVVPHHHVLGLVREVRRHHELEPRALTCGEPARPAVVDLVPLHKHVRRTALRVCAPVTGIVNAVVADDSVLHSDEVERVVLSPVDVAVLDVDVARLVHLEEIVCRPSTAVENHRRESHVQTALAVEGVAVRSDGDVSHREVPDIEDVHLREERDGAGALRCGDLERPCGGAVPRLPVRRQRLLVVDARFDADLVRGADVDSLRDPGPRLGHRSHGVGAGCSVARVIARAAHPDHLPRARPWERARCGGRARCRGRAGNRNRGPDGRCRSPYWPYWPRWRGNGAPGS
ncbi:unannotated protein [freshwater metagenome]|uniref:Unannotated protein n=1 Tax=freshwater metagenome TaxID=449393 RepID=A0A6J7EH28_9ZZZZ